MEWDGGLPCGAMEPPGLAAEGATRTAGGYPCSKAGLTRPGPVVPAANNFAPTEAKRYTERKAAAPCGWRTGWAARQHRARRCP